MAGVGVFMDEFQVDRAEGEPAFTVDLDGFEGPLDDKRRRSSTGGWRARGLPWTQS